jgi:hypothetical protein
MVLILAILTLLSALPLRPRAATATHTAAKETVR